MKFKNYTDFNLNENDNSVEIPTMNEFHNFINMTLYAVKKLKKITRHRSSGSYIFVFDNKSFSVDIIYSADEKEYYGRNNKISAKEQIEKYLNPAIFKVAGPDNMGIIDVFPDTITATYKSNSFIFTKNKAKCKHYKIDNSSPNAIYNIEYDLKTEESSITYDDIINTEAFKNLLEEIPLQVSSNSKQINNQNFIFSLPVKYVHDKKDKPEILSFDNKFYRYAYSINKTGYIRSVNTFKAWNDDIEVKYTLSSRFNSSSLKGWEDGINKIKELYLKMINNMKKDNIDVYYTKDDIHKNRGTIASKTFNI